MTKRTILIVEDDRNLADAIRYNLSNEGYRVVSAADGIQTLEVARESMDAFVKQDGQAARQIVTEDDEVDYLYLERSADRVTNTCERVVFTVTGKMEEIGASKY